MTQFQPRTYQVSLDAQKGSRKRLSLPSLGVVCEEQFGALQLFCSHEETKLKIKIIMLKRAEQKGRMYPVP